MEMILSVPLPAWPFITLMCILAIVDVWNFQRGIEQYKDLKGQIVGLGVLGTFVGIYIGLEEFEIDGDLEVSIQNLLGGLKTVFATSIVGMSLNILITLYQKYHRTAPDEEFSTLLLKDISTQLGTVLPGRIDAAIQRSSEVNRAELIGLLNDVVKNFNEIFQEQFGENLRRFDDSLGKMLTWQDSAEQSLENTQARNKAALEGLQEVNKTLGAVVTQSSDVHRVNSETRDVVSKLATSTQTLDKAIRSLDQRYNKFDDLSSALQDLYKTVEEGSIKLSKSLDELPDTKIKVEGFKRSMRNAMDELSGSLKGVAQEIASDVGSVTRSLKGSANSIAEAQEEVNGTAISVERKARGLAEKIDRLDQVVERQDTQARRFSRSVDDLAESLSVGLRKATEKLVSLRSVIEELEARVEDVPISRRRGRSPK